MVELEISIIPTLGRLLLKCKKYVDDTFCYIKISTVTDILNKLNVFHQNIQFTYELEKNNVFLIHNKDTIETTVYRKPTNSDIFELKLFSPISWKCGTLKTIIRRAYFICSKPDYLQKELDHIAYVFEKFNNYSKWVIKQLLEEVKYNLTEPVMKYCKSMK